MDLRCRKTLCEYNKKYTCTAKEINVSNKMLCNTFEKSKEPKSAPDTSKTMFQKAPDYAPQRESKTCCINCKAPCLFNIKNSCTANGITVNTIKEKPLCVTYIKK